MTLTDPREALADKSDFIGYLVGLAGLSQVVHTLAADGDRRAGGPHDPDDFVHVLLGFASMGAAIERLANLAVTQQNQTSGSPPCAAPTTRWLR
ncbi:hypothetical protein [Mycobacterium sp. E3198]|uniref:hypothetical protein n=1 Tax=Mycobacterium sp. E3198 TaxID=1834143 RepID=UPI0007FB7FAC|nr:hypothetical protein [Mycobacterium sp. E3198]OBG31070.1 hypothetical protein A5673_27880 [Mycobacterium sp. E3198]